MGAFACNDPIVADMRTDRRIILAIGNQRTVYEIPVYQKGSLNEVSSITRLKA